MARRAALALLLFGLLGSLVSTQDDFDLSFALDDDKKPTSPPKVAPGNDYFDLTDALGGGGNDDRVSPDSPKPKPQPNPKQPGTSGETLLIPGSGRAPGEGIDCPPPGFLAFRGGSEGKESACNEGDLGESPGVIPGIVGAVVVALGGAISSFIAYQKKKLCFKENAEEGEVNMENHRTNAEPAVQQTLLEK
ncbi:unnamed protein product [Rangifer tarandus platyrhynchus]|uniref:Uncharacterized protein n=1 Tax=Rangifer tarandus platyrhynchus TaxID=3082113 RepID=A0ACB1KHI7_RANTA